MKHFANESNVGDKMLEILKRKIWFVKLSNTDDSFLIKKIMKNIHLKHQIKLV